MFLKPTFRPVLLVFFRLLKCYQNGGKILEGIESLRQRNYGMRVLNNLDHVDSWKPILNSFFDRERNCKGR